MKTAAEIETKHTAGPWRVIEAGPGKYRVRGMAGPIEVDVAEVYGGPDDARLIAAAPELLEELKHCGSAMEEAANLIRPNFPRAADLFDIGAERVRLVVAKAEGRSA